jgi:hypothetical protein
MKYKIYSIIIIMLIGCVAANVSKAQYSFSPSKTLIKNQTFNNLTYDSIHIANNSSDTLHLSWQKIQFDSIGGTYVDFCASGECYLGIPVSGSFPPIKPGGFGYAGVHLWTGSQPSNCIARIWVYKAGDIAHGDTLTYILHAIPGSGTEIIKDNELTFSLYPNPASEKIYIQTNINNGKDIKISIYNILGEVIYSNSASNTSFNIPLDNISKGIYFLQLESGNKTLVKKFAVKG